MTRKRIIYQLPGGVVVPPLGTSYFARTIDAPAFQLVDVRLTAKNLTPDVGEIEFVQVGNVIVCRWARIPIAPRGANVTVTARNVSREPQEFMVEIEGDELGEF